MAAVIDRLGLFVRLSFDVRDLNMICLLRFRLSNPRIDSSVGGSGCRAAAGW
jgi:hypothetical protein